MASLTNTKIKDTYPGLLKTTDNAALGGTYKLITDGLGNSSNVYLGTGGNVGIGTSSPTFKLDVAGSARSNFFALRLNQSLPSESSAIYRPATGTFAIVTAAAERMRIDSSGKVGIGYVPESGHGNFNTIITGASTAKFHLGFGSNGDNYYTAGSSGIHAFRNDTTERMRIDSSGKVGIGVTNPSSFFNQARNLVVGGSGNVGATIYSSSSGNTFLAFADVADGANSGFSAGGSIYYEHANDAMVTRVNGSERMRIDSSGNVGIGTNNPSTKLHVYESNPLDHITIDGNNGDNRNLRFATENSTRWNLYATGTSETGSNVGSDLSIARYTDSGSYNGNVLMILRNSGYVGIGTSSPSANLQISGSSDVGLRIKSGASSLSYIDFDDADSGTPSGSIAYNNIVDSMTFATGGSNTERMRITSAGRIHFYNLLGSSATQSDVRYDTTSKEIFYNTSSERYKTDIVDLENTLDKVNLLRTVRYKDIETEQETTGLIAEEVIEVIPEVVFKKEIEGFNEPQPEGINYSDFAPFLIKAIQELKAEIETLKSQINS